MLDDGKSSHDPLSDELKYYLLWNHLDLSVVTVNMPASSLVILCHQTKRP